MDTAVVIAAIIAAIASIIVSIIEFKASILSAKVKATNETRYRILGKKSSVYW